MTQNESPTTKKPALVFQIGLTALIFFLSLFVYVPNRYSNPFSTRGEGREAVVVFNMFEQDNFILPRRNGASIPSKPPMFHWLAVAAAHVTGEFDEFAIRLPSAITGALCLSIFFFVVSNTFNLVLGLTSTLILGTMFEFFRGASVARVDMVFCLFQTIALLAGYRIIIAQPGSKTKRWWFLGVGVALGFAVLSKGPAGLVLPWGIIGTTLLLSRGIKKIPFIPIAASVAATVSIAAVWYYLAYKIGGDEFLDVAIMRENVARITGSNKYITGHKSPFYTGPLLFLVGGAPWSLLFPFCTWVIWKRRREFFNEKTSFLTYCGIWVAVFFIFILITSSKRSVYLLPAYPAIAVLMAYVFSLSLGELNVYEKTKALSTSLVSVLGGVILFATGAILSINQFFGSKLPPDIQLKEDDMFVVRRVLDLFLELPPLYWCFVAPGLMIIFSANRINTGLYREAILSLSFATAALVIVVNQVLLPEISQTQSPNQFMQRIKQIVSPMDPFFIYKEDYYPAVFYMRRNILSTSTIPETDPGQTAFLLVEDDKLPGAQIDFPHAEFLLRSDEIAAYGKGHLNLLRFAR